MTQSTVVLIVLSLFLGVGVLLVFLWAVKRGQFEDLEGPKHRILRDDDRPAAGDRERGPSLGKRPEGEA